MGNTTVKIFDMSADGKNQVILIVVSVGTQYFEKDCFEPLADALAKKVDDGELSPDTPCIIWRADVQQRHTLSYREVDLKAGQRFLSEKEALALSIYNGDKWENDCRFALDKLKLKFKNFRIIKLEQDSKDPLLYSNLNFNIRKLEEKTSINLPRALNPLVLPTYEIVKENDEYIQQKQKFDKALSEIEAFRVEHDLAVDSYYTSFTANVFKGVFANALPISVAQRDAIKTHSGTYIREDVINLNTIICNLLKEFSNKQLCFIYPFPHGNATESATLQVISLFMEKSLFEKIIFPRVIININNNVSAHTSKSGTRRISKHVATHSDGSSKIAIEAGDEKPDDTLKKERHSGELQRGSLPAASNNANKRPQPPSPPVVTPAGSPESNSPPRGEPLLEQKAKPAAAPAAAKGHSAKAPRRTTGFTEVKQNGSEGVSTKQADYEKSRESAMPSVNDTLMHMLFYSTSPRSKREAKKDVQVVTTLAQRALAIEQTLAGSLTEYDAEAIARLALSLTVTHAFLANQAGLPISKGSHEDIPGEESEEMESAPPSQSSSPSPPPTNGH